MENPQYVKLDLIKVQGLKFHLSPKKNEEEKNQKAENKENIKKRISVLYNGYELTSGRFSQVTHTTCKTFSKDIFSLLVYKSFIINDEKQHIRMENRKGNSFSKKALTDLLSTATMISPSTMLPAKPLVVGSSPAFAARLFPGT